jgi:hypothetical protein
MPSRPLRRVLDSNAPLDLRSDSNSVPSQRMLLDSGIEQGDPFTLDRLALCCFAPVDCGQRVSNCLCAAVEIVVASSFGNLSEDGVDEGVFVAAAFTPRDDVEGDFNGALQFGDGPLEVQPLGWLEALRQHDNNLSLQTRSLGYLEESARRERLNNSLRAIDREIPANDMATVRDDCAGVGNAAGLSGLLQVVLFLRQLFLIHAKLLQCKLGHRSRHRA